MAQQPSHTIAGNLPDPEEAQDVVYSVGMEVSAWPDSASALKACLHVTGLKYDASMPCHSPLAVQEVDPKASRAVRPTALFSALITVVQAQK